MAKLVAQMVYGSGLRFSEVTLPFDTRRDRSQLRSRVVIAAKRRGAQNAFRFICEYQNKPIPPSKVAGYTIALSVRTTSGVSAETRPFPFDCSGTAAPSTHACSRRSPLLTHVGPTISPAGYAAYALAVRRTLECRDGLRHRRPYRNQPCRRKLLLAKHTGARGTVWVHLRCSRPA